MSTRTIGSTYLLLGGILAAFVAMLLAMVRSSSGLPQLTQPAAAALVQPVVALAALTGIVCLLMIVVRNLAFIRGAASERYFRTFAEGDKPAEWVERPTRAYMNLLELPVLFYLVCVLMLTTGKYDQLQVVLAWIFVITRYVHALVYIVFNHVPLRFMAYFCGVLTLALMWTRFAGQNWGLT